MKTHPSREDWMSFLYGEDTPARHIELDAHLRSCAGCQQQVQAWRGSMAALDTWETPKPRRGRSAAPVLQWAAAAAIVLGVGFGFGRVSSSANGELRAMHAALRTEMESKLAAAHTEFAQTLQLQRAELVDAIHIAAAEASNHETEQLFAKFARVLDEQRDADHRAYLAALKSIEERRAEDYATLRKDLDTVAVNADDGLTRAQEKLMELATMTQAPSPSN